MLYLILNIVFASSFMLCIKWMHNRGQENVITVGALNYIMALVVITPFALAQNVGGATPRAFAIGGTMGLCYFVAYFFAIYAIRWIGAASATVISVLSLVLPIVVGVFIWDERPNVGQVVGIILALLSLLLIGGAATRRPSDPLPLGEQPPHNLTAEIVDRSWFRPLMLLTFFLLCGLARLAQAAYDHLCPLEPVSHFTFASFTLAAIPSLGLLAIRRRGISRSELTFGILMGSVNALQTQFIVLALNHFESFIVFPVVSAGGLLLTTLVVTTLLHERLTRQAYLGIGLACVALLLLKIQLD